MLLHIAARNKRAKDVTKRNKVGQGRKHEPQARFKESTHYARTYIYLSIRLSTFTLIESIFLHSLVPLLDTATWVSRYPSDENLASLKAGKGGKLTDLAPIQRDKFSHFFTYLLDHDKDGFIDRKDFRIFSEVSTNKRNRSIELLGVQIPTMKFYFE